jgi:ubiquinone/menaquinone biosynthesis C-methylase UbiE
MLNKRAPSPNSNPDGIIKILSLKQGQDIADTGSGGGYFSFKFANIVGKDSKVFAVDTNPEFLRHIERSAKERGASNITTVLAKEDGFALAEHSLDLIFLRNVTHHLPNRVSYFGRLRSLLKPGGRIAIFEYKPGGGFNFRRLFGHFVPKEELVKEINEAGFGQYQNFDMLPEQSFLIFA